MGTLAKEKVVINLTDTTLANLSGETVEVLERGASYPGSAISCTAGTGAAYRYRPDSDLDTTKAYYVYAGGNIVGSFEGYDARTNWMGQAVINVLSLQAYNSNGITLKDDAGTNGLVVNDGATVTIPKTVTVGSNGSTSGQITFVASDNDQATIGINTSDQLAFAGASGGYTFSGGNIGIGTTSPFRKTQINSGVDAIGLSVGMGDAEDGWTGIVMGRQRSTSNGEKVGIFYEDTDTWSRGSLHFATDNTEDASTVTKEDARMTITSAGNVGIGTTTPVTLLNQAKWSADALGSYHTFSKSRNATQGSHTIVQDNDSIGGLNFAPSDGTDFGTIAAQIKSSVDDASPAASSIGGDLTFSTAKGAGADDLTLALTITKDQYAVFNGRIQGLKGADVASGGTLTLGNGNYFDITGTTTITDIMGTGWQSGSIVVLQFDASVTVTHGAAGGGGSYGIQLAGAGNFSATAGDTLILIFEGDQWREVARTVI